MRQFIRISPDSWIKPVLREGVVWGLLLLILPACQNRAPSLRMLDQRAGYNSDLDEREVGIYQRGKVDPNSPHALNTQNAIFRKSAPKVSRVYIYPHELPSKDYFWGGYVSLVVSPDEWIVENSDANSSIGQQFKEMPPATAPISMPKESPSEKGDQK